MSTPLAYRFALALVSLSLAACAADDLGDNERAVALPAPTNLQVTVTAQTGMSLTWDASPGAAKYVVQVGPTPGAEETITSVASTETSWAYQHLELDTTYCWVVRNVNADGETSEPSNSVCATTADAPVPAVPVATATATATTRIRVTWPAVADADYYRVYAAPTPDAPVYVTTVVAPSTALIHVGLEPGTEYGFAVEALNEAGTSGLSPVVTATTPTAGIPSGVVATAVSTSRIDVTWAAVPGALSYQVFAAISPATPVFVATVRAPTTSFGHAGLLADTTYGYQVRAVLAVGTSELSTPPALATTFADTDPPCVDGWCWIYPDGAEGSIRLTAGTADDDVWAVTEREHSGRRSYQTLHWNGTDWRDLPFPDGDGGPYVVTDIWSIGRHDVWMAGGKLENGCAERVLWHWDGLCWTRVDGLGSENGDDGFVAVWGAAGDDVYALAPTALFHFDGVAWTVDGDVPGGTDLFGSAADDVYVLDGADVWRNDGTAWTSRTAPEAVWRGASNGADDVWLVGAVSNLHYDGTAFTTLESGGPALRSIPLGTRTDMFTFSATMNRRLGGVAATPVSTPIFFEAGSTWHTAGGRVYAAGDGLLVH
jgi:fibronectin type 3 domain-containing protein